MLQATIVAELKLLQTQFIDYSAFWSHVTDAHHNSVQRDSRVHPSHPASAMFSCEGGNSFATQSSSHCSVTRLISGRTFDAESLSTVDRWKLKSNAMGTTKLQESGLSTISDSEAGEGQTVPRRDSSQSGQSPMSAVYFGRHSRVSDRSIPRSRQTVSIEDRPPQFVRSVHFHNNVNNNAPRRAMVRDAADKGRPCNGHWRHFTLWGTTRDMYSSNR